MKPVPSKPSLVRRFPNSRVLLFVQALHFGLFTLELITLEATLGHVPESLNMPGALVGQFRRGREAFYGSEVCLYAWCGCGSSRGLVAHPFVIGMWPRYCAGTSEPGSNQFTAGNREHRFILGDWRYNVNDGDRRRRLNRNHTAARRHATATRHRRHRRQSRNRPLFTPTSTIMGARA